MTARYMVTSGFLGSGKTTSMIAFAKNINSRGLGHAAILANDLGAGNIVDADYTATTGITTTRITGNCICYQHENLVDKLHQLVSQGADVIFSDIPGCGIGALDNVYIQLDEKEKGEFILMPFMCIADPIRLRMLMRYENINLPAEMTFLLDAQLKEADVIVLNKTDMISEKDKEECVSFLKERYPDTPVFAISALTGENVDCVVDYILSSSVTPVHKELGYGSDEFIAAEMKLSWYNRRVFFESREQSAEDFNAILDEIISEIKIILKSSGNNVPHLKLFASDADESPSDFYKASLIGVAYDIEHSNTLKNRYTALSVVINARAAAQSQTMADAVDDAIDIVSQKYNLKAKTFFLESFGMMEEGKGNCGRASKY